MFYKTILFFISVCLFMSITSYAQYENFWVFGGNAGVNFNSNPPQVVRTAISTNEGSASICNDQGQLLFYTDGTLVWDRNDNVMPNGNDLPGIGVNITASTTQGALIIPVPGNTQLYYIFSLGDLSSGIYSGNLYYSVVDMSLNNGLGAVVTGRKGILLSKGLTEHMTAVSGGNCNIWLMVMPKYGTEFKAYNVDFNGIDTVPVVSAKVTGGGVYTGVLGSIDVAPDRSKLAIAQGNLVLYNFDRSTGQISNPVLLDKGFSPYYYGVCFSPDNSKLYGSTESPLFQFDLSTADTTAMIASKKQIATPPGYPAIKRGPDGKVYCAGHGEALNVINQPNLAGAACQYVNKGLPLLSGTTSRFGLPNSATIVINRKIYSAIKDTVYCSDSFLLEPRITSGINYAWEDGSIGMNRYVQHTGTYWVSYQFLGIQCEEYVDTFHSVVYAITRINSTTTFEGMCSADTFLMVASHSNANNYTWEDGSTGKTRKMNRSGVFWVSYQSDTACEHFIDSFRLFYPEEEYEVSFSTDTLTCQQQLLFLHNTSDPHYQRFNWIWGDGQSSSLKNPDHFYSLPGTYEILLTGRINEKCMDTFAQLLLVDSLLPVSFVMSRDELCVGEFITVDHQMTSNTIKEILWQWGDGYESGNSTDYKMQHAYDSSGLMLVRMRVDFRSCPDDSFNLPVRVFALPKIQLYSENGLCLQGAPLTLKNLRQDAIRGYHYLWSTGSTADSIQVTHHGQYSLTVSAEPLGCSTTETMEINKECYIDIPNAFTPNGDGINDYFLPRQVLSDGMMFFKMEIFNRWGRRVFISQNNEGRGWDGKVNGQEQPIGVYVYKIEISYGNGKVEFYKGNVSLLR